MTKDEIVRWIEDADLLTEGEKEVLIVLALAGEPQALEVVEELSRRPLGPQDGYLIAAGKYRRTT